MRLWAGITFVTWAYYVLFGFAPGIFWLWYFRHKDDLELEPRHTLFWAFGMGCLSAGVVYYVRPYLDPFIPHSPLVLQHLVDAFVITAGFEELVKGLAFFLGAYFLREFDEPLDGIVYGVAVALGFASVENVLYLMTHGELYIVVLRAFTAVLAHVACTGSLGFFFGLAKYAPPWRRIMLMMTGLYTAILFHGHYDFFLFQGGNIAYLSLLCVLPLILVLLGLKIRWLRARSHLFHGPTADRTKKQPPNPT